MAKFPKNTDDVRTTSSLASGMLCSISLPALSVQFLLSVGPGLSSHSIARLRPPGTRLRTCPILAEATRDMSEDVSLPCFGFAGPLVAAEQVFDAQAYEVSALSSLTRCRQARQQAMPFWGFTSALSQFSSTALLHASVARLPRSPSFSSVLIVNE